MVFDEIERLKSEWTDKYVVVDGGRPELARFQQAVGQVRTVNMNGRALVQFDRNADIAWYDIELPFLKQVPKPEPKAEDKGHRAPAETKTAAPAKPAPAKSAPAKGAEKSRATSDILAAARGGAKQAPAAGGAKPSTKDILAAARAKASSPPAAGAPESPAKAAASPSPPKAPAAPPAAKPAGGKLSTADILAAARGKGASTNAASASPPSTAAPAAEKPAEPPAPPAEAAPRASADKPAAAKPSAGDLPTTTAERIAWCRQRDARG